MLNMVRFPAGTVEALGFDVADTEGEILVNMRRSSKVIEREGDSAVEELVYVLLMSNSRLLGGLSKSLCSLSGFACET